MLLIRTDANGNVAWVKTYGGPERELITDVIQTADNGFLLLAEKYQPNKVEGEILTLIKTNELGNITWKKIYDEGGHETEGFSIQATPDGGYIMTGVVKKLSVVSSAFFTMVGEEQSLYVLKVDGNGNKLWSRSLTAGNDRSITTGATGVITRDGSYVVTGNITRKPDQRNSSSGKEMNVNMLLAKIRSDGTLEWTREYEGRQITAGSMIKEKKDGGLIVAGVVSLTESNLDILIMDFNQNGEVLWSKTYGGSNLESASDIIQAPDDGFLVLGITESFGSGSSDVLLFKIDRSGNVAWANAYGGKNEEYPSRLALVPDGIVIAGTTASFSSESFDVLLMKTTKDGTHDCLGTPVTLRVAGMQLSSLPARNFIVQDIKQAITPPNIKKMNVNNIIEVQRQVRVKELCD